MTNPTRPAELLVRDANSGVTIRGFTVDPDGSMHDLAHQMLAAADLCYVLGTADGITANITPVYPTVPQTPAEPVYTVVLVDRAPEHADEGDFVAVVGVTQADLEGPGDWLGLLQEAMAECTQRDAVQAALDLRDVVKQTSPEGAMSDDQ